VRERLLDNSQSSPLHRKGYTMKRRWSIAVFAGCCLGLFALLGTQSASDNRSSEEEAVRAVNQAWFKAYTSGNINSLVALYADDAVVSNPGAQPARGQAAIREALTRDLAESREAGMTLNPNPTTEMGISGDMAWEWGSFSAVDKSGATADRGKYLSVLEKRNGKWLIVRDMWNSDMPVQAGKQ
jgi:uncharacterized protein (TIGR02246 family)